MRPPSADEQTYVPDDREPVGAGALRERVERLTKFEMADWPGQDFLLYEDVIALAATDPGVPSGAGLDVERLAAWRLTNAADALTRYARFADDPGHRSWFPAAIADVEREIALTRAAAAPPPTTTEYTAEYERLALERADAPAGEEELRTAVEAVARRLRDPRVDTSSYDGRAALAAELLAALDRRADR